MHAEPGLVWTDLASHWGNSQCAVRGAEQKILRANGFAAIAARRWRIAVPNAVQTTWPGNGFALIAVLRSPRFAPPYNYRHRRKPRQSFMPQPQEPMQQPRWGASAVI